MSVPQLQSIARRCLVLFIKGPDYELRNKKQIAL
jgi:hypothetical protein